MIGIEAMSVIAKMTGHNQDAANYSRIAHDYIRKWQNLGIAQNANPPHTTLSYHNDSSHGMSCLYYFCASPSFFLGGRILTPLPAGLLYNLFADAQLGLGLVPQSVYTMQSNFYPTAENTYGVPLDTRHSYTKGDYSPCTYLFFLHVLYTNTS